MMKYVITGVFILFATVLLSYHYSNKKDNLKYNVLIYSYESNYSNTNIHLVKTKHLLKTLKYITRACDISIDSIVGHEDSLMFSCLDKNVNDKLKNEYAKYNKDMFMETCTLLFIVTFIIISTILVLYFF